MHAIVATPQQKQMFKGKYERYGIGTISPEYLEHAFCRVFYLDAQLVGGYLINTQSPFRFNDFIGSARVDEQRSAEICCIFIDTMREEIKARILVYALLDLLKTNRPILVAGTGNEKLAGLFKVLFPTPVFEGTNQVLKTRQWVMQTTRTTIVPRFVSYMARRWRRSFAAGKKQSKL